MMDMLETCEGVVQYTIPEEEGEEGYDENYINLLPPLVDFDAALPFLRGGIPSYNDDGTPNKYWDRWPALRTKTMSLFYGVGDGAAATIGSKCGPGSNRIAVTIGTSAAARVCLPLSAVFDDEGEEEEPKISVPPGLFCYRVHRDAVVIGGALTGKLCLEKSASGLAR